jgi:hypothetical protein
MERAQKSTPVVAVVVVDVNGDGDGDVNGRRGLLPGF